MNQISCVIITRNESENLRRCLNSVSWADEIVVVDAQSTDDTREIAAEFTDKVFNLKWKGFGPAKEFARSQASGKWILSLDADEVVPDQLGREIQKVIESANPADGFYIPRRSNFLGRWMEHGGWYPDRVLRLFKRNRGHFNSRLVHEEVKISGNTGCLKNDLLHYTDPEFDHYLRKLNQYTTLNALQLSQEGRRSNLVDILIKPPAAFIKMYVLKKGFLDGREGLILSVSSAFHVFAKYVKLWHLNRWKTNSDSR